MNQNPAGNNSLLQSNLDRIRDNVRAAAQQSGRCFEDITILAATKTQDADSINEAIELGVNCIGENRVQELLEKYERYDKRASVQFIGHLQLNKVKYIVGKVDLIQSVDSFRLAAEIERQSLKAGCVTDILVEVNIGREDSKSGVYPEDLRPLLAQLSPLEHIRVRGLMTIPPICESVEQSRYFFSSLHKEFLDISAKKLDNVNMDFLSMGMSADYVCAVECGANLIRIGTGLFGTRKM